MRVMLRSGIVCVHCEVKRLEGAERLMMVMAVMRLAQLMRWIGLGCRRRRCLDFPLKLPSRLVSPSPLYISESLQRLKAVLVLPCSIVPSGEAGT